MKNNSSEQRNCVERLLRHNSQFGYHGWALMTKGADQPMFWTIRTTRQEVRDLWSREKNWMRPDIEIVKVTIKVEVVD